MWWTKRSIGLHITITILLPAFSGLAYWQVSRALSGNTLSWVYVFEWPFFGGYAIFLWWKLVHEDLASDSSHDSWKSAKALDKTSRSKTTVSACTVTAESKVDQQLAAYNLYLASLHQGDNKAHAIAPTATVPPKALPPRTLWCSPFRKRAIPNTATNKKGVHDDVYTGEDPCPN